MYLPPLKQIDVEKFTEFDGELDGGLEFAHFHTKSKNFPILGSIKTKIKEKSIVANQTGKTKEIFFFFFFEGRGTTKYFVIKKKKDYLRIYLK